MLMGKKIIIFSSLPLENANRTKGTKTYANGDTVLTDDTTTDIPKCVFVCEWENEEERAIAASVALFTRNASKRVLAHTICGELFHFALVCGRGHTRKLWMCARTQALTGDSECVQCEATVNLFDSDSKIRMDFVLLCRSRTQSK